MSQHSLVGNPWATAFASHGQAVAVVDDAGNTASYADVLARADQLTAALGRRSLVVLRASNSTASVATWLALLASDHATLLVEHDLPEPRLAALQALYQPDAIIDPLTPDMISPLAGGTPLHPALGVLLSTSGSTGSPKLARFTAAALWANAAAIADYLELAPSERAYLCLPTSYSYGMSVINSHALVGATVLVTGHGVMAAPFWDRLASSGATSFAGVPFHYDAIRRLGIDRLAAPGLHTLTQAGGRLPLPVAQKYAAWAADNGRRFVCMYGQTEAGPRLTWLPPQLLASHAGSIGVPIPGVSIDLVAADGGVIADAGVAGEMRCTSPAIMMGYALNAADLAKGDELVGVLMTGDLATRDADGLLTISGRISRMIKLFGTRINLDDIDNRLAAMEVSGVAFGRDDLLQVLIETGEPDSVREALVAAFAFPPRGLMVRRVAALPRASSGKLVYAALSDAWETAT